MALGPSPEFVTLPAMRLRLPPPLRARAIGSRGVFGALRGVFYGWYLVGVASMMLTIMSLTVFQSTGTYFVALNREFGWSRTLLSGGFAFSRIQGAAIGPIEGFLIDRFGNRTMFIFGFSMMGAGFLMLSQLREGVVLLDVLPFSAVMQYYIALGVITIGSGLGGWLTMMSMVNNWFSRQRSFAMATAMSGIHFGGFLVPVLAFFIDHEGFRPSMMVIGVLVLAIVAPVALVMRNKPEDYGMRPDGDPPQSATARVQGEGTSAAPGSDLDSEPEYTAWQALKTPAFWVVTIVHMSSTLSLVALSVHLAPKLTDMGMSLTGAGFVAFGYTLIALPFQFLSGYIADRLPKPPLICLFLLTQAAALVVIAYAENVFMAYVFALLWGIAFGGRGPLLTAIRGDYFGRKAFATIMGLSQLPTSIVMVITPLYAGYVFDVRGSYFIPFMSFAFCALAGAVLIMFARRPDAGVHEPYPIVAMFGRLGVGSGRERAAREDER